MTVTSMTVIPEFEPVLAEVGLTDYAAVMATRQGESLIKPGLGDRERIRLEAAGRILYLKRYASNAPARTEWDALQAVQAAGVPTMQPVAMGAGEAGGFIIVTAVPGDALSRRMDELLTCRGSDPVVHEGLAAQLGQLAAKLHAAGLAHRDLYTAHVFVDEVDGRLDLYLIDLARVFTPLRWKWRWWLKDLAQLKFSLPPAWRRQHWSDIQQAYETARRTSLPWWAGCVIAVRVWRMARRMRRGTAAQRQGA